MNLDSYATEGFYDEMFEADGKPRSWAQVLADRFAELPEGEMRRRQRMAESTMFELGITFNVYGATGGVERIFPFDVVPRIVEPGEWSLIERGLKQRIRALNLFINDVYHGQEIIRDGVVPDHLVNSSKCFLKQCVGFTPPRGVWCHIVGTDLVRDGDGRVYVLEDNLRCPSGVSYPKPVQCSDQTRHRFACRSDGLVGGEARSAEVSEAGAEGTGFPLIV